MARSFELPVVLRAIDKVTGPLRKVGGKLTDFGKKTRKVGRNLSTGVTAPVVAFGALTLASAANFEQSMNRVGALADVTGAKFESLVGQAKDLGSTTQFTASQVAGAQALMAQAGRDTAQILATTPEVLNLSAAAVLDMEESASILARTMSGYKLPADDARRATNVLTGAFVKANQNLVDMGEAMKLAGPVAKGFGLEFEDAAAGVAFFAEQGFAGSLGGTSFRNALLELVESGGKTAKVLGELGVQSSQLFRDDGTILSFANTLRVLEDAGITPFQAMELFGKRGGPAMVAALDAGADAYDQFAAAVLGVDAAKIAERQMSGTVGEVKALTSAFEGLQLAIAKSGLLKDFTDVVTKLTEMVRGLSESNPGLLRMGTVVALVAAAVGPLLVGLGLAAQGIGGISTGLAKVMPHLSTLVTFLTTKAIPAIWSAGAAFLATPFGPVIVGVGAVVAAGYLLVRNWERVAEFFGGIWDWFGDKVHGFVQFAIEKITALTDWLPDWVSEKLGLDGDLSVSVGGERISEANAVAGGGSRGRGGDRSRVEVDFRNLPTGARVFTDAGPDADLDVTSGFALGGA